MKFALVKAAQLAALVCVVLLAANPTFGQWGFSNPSGRSFDGIRVRDSFGPSSSTPSNPSYKPDIGKIIVGGILQGIANAQNNRPNFQPRPQYYYQPRRNVYRPPANYASTPQPAPVPKNVVKTRKVPQKNRNALQDAGRFMLTNGVAVTDAQQAVEAGQQGGTVDRDIRSLLGDGDAARDWANVVANGSQAADIKAFQEKHRLNIMPGSQLDKLLDYRQSLAEYQEQLVLGGGLTSLQKDSAIANLGALGSAAYPNPGRKQQVQQFVGRLQGLNQLGELSQLVGTQNNPTAVLIEGATNAGYPISLVGEMTGLPLTDESPVGDTTSSTAKGLLVNPASTGQTVRYTLGGREYSMRPGERQELNRSYVVQFDTGRGRTRRFQIGGGTFEWRMEDDGWMVRRVQVNVVLDNSQYDGDFHYLMNGERSTVRAGDIVEHSSDLPIEIIFDRGAGGKEARKLLSSGRYVVAVDVDAQQLDLFEEQDVADDLYASEPRGTAASRGRSARHTRQQRIDDLLQGLKQSNVAGSDRAVDVFEPASELPEAFRD